jgi:aminoglycoside N3'-acetyltransferase
VPKHITVLRDDKPTRLDYLENDHCCQRFALADGWLRGRGLQREGPVGNAHARLLESRDVVAVVREQLEGNPLIFLHDEQEGCAECVVARRSVQSARTSETV